MKWLVLVFLLLAAPAMADLELTYTWGPATSGSEAVLYHVQVISAGGTWSDYADVAANSILISVADDTQDFQISVAGIDQYGMMGPYSEPSDPFTYGGPPGQPGKPSIVSIIAAAVLFLAALLLFFRRDSQDAE